MKTNEEIKGLSNLQIVSQSDDGGMGYIYYGKLKASVVWSNGGGWDHVSMSPMRKSYTPSWDEMCKLKRMFFKPEETVLEYHPAESQYIDNMTNCLHLWRPQDYEIPLPPRVYVGVPKGISTKQFMKELEEGYDKPYALTSGMLDGSRKVNNTKFDAEKEGHKSENEN